MNCVNGNAKIFRRLAHGQAFNKHKIDGGLAKLGCVLTHRGNAPQLAFVEQRSAPFEMSTHRDSLRVVNYGIYFLDYKS